MFSIGEQVIHYRDGLSYIHSTEKIGDNEYYIIIAYSNPDDRVFVLKSHPEKVIRKILSEEEALALVHQINEIKPDFSLNTKQRRDQIKKRLISGNPYEMSYLYKQLLMFLEKKEEDNSIKLGPTDIEMLESAKMIFLDELAISLNVGRDQIEQRIYEIIKQ